MIVFTAKSKITTEVYVGSARESVEEHWAHLIIQAEEGGTGNLLELVRKHGADQIEIETWAFADSPAESRELIRDACEDLNAEAIKTGRAPAVKTTVPAKSKPSTSPVHIEAKKAPQPKKPANSEHGPVVSIDVSEYQSSKKQKEFTEVTPEVVTLRHSESTKVAEDMKSVMIRIEMQRKKNMKTYTPPKKTTKKATKASKVAAAAAANSTAEKSKKLKLPDGRVSSSVKEKKIKEAIAQEKLQRQADHRAQTAAEADDMAALLARLDQRTAETGKVRRRR